MVGLRLTEKNRFYLARLGYIDNRHGQKGSSKALNTSEFINRCITIVLENSKGIANATADPEELRRAYYKFLIAENNKQVEKLEEQNRKLSAQMKKEMEVVI
jgi:hypothetical protein